MAARRTDPTAAGGGASEWRPRGGALLALLARWLVVAVGVAAAVLGLGGTRVSSLEVGDCVAHLHTGPHGTLPTAPCVVQHQAEVVATADGVGSDAAARELCARALERHPGVGTRGGLTGRTERSHAGHVVCLVVGDLSDPLRTRR